MTFLTLALLPTAIALCLLVALALSVLVRSLQGERWEVPLEEMGPAMPNTNIQVNSWMADGLASKSVA